MSPEESELLAAVGRELWLATAVGSPAPFVKELGKRMRHPRPGDLVLEVTRWGAFDPDSIGRLVSTEPPGAATGDITDRWVVEPLHAPGTVFGWQNADFIALPDKRKWLEEQEAASAPGDVPLPGQEGS